ncbi:MAG: NAD(P)-dependent oxidoreductase [Dehalococcoidia bacterium]
MTTLITGGMGFIGLHTAKAFIDAGEDVVITWYQTWREPSFIKDEYGKRVQVEKADVSQGSVIKDLALKHKVDNIVHLAVPGLGALSPAEDFHVNMDGLIGVLEAAREAGVKRLGLASSGAIYGALPSGPFRETDRLPLESGSPTETFKKSWEILAGHYGKRTEMDIVMLRIGGIYGPLYHSMSNLPSRLVHAAVKGTEADYSRGGVPFRDDLTNLCYVKDCAQGIRTVQLAEELQHTVYNVGSGQAISNGDLHDAVLKVKPNAKLQIQEGKSPRAKENGYMDGTRLSTELGYKPRYSIDTAVADYAAWLEAGNEY